MIRQNHLKLFYFTIFFFIFKLSIFADVDVTGTIKTAYLKDAYGISGIHYQCNNGTLKTTGADGSFSYDNTCSTITFSLNNKVILGTKSVANIPTDYKLFITDLAGDNRTDTNKMKVRNIARLLQSLDDDEIPTNGLKISSSQIATSNNIDLSIFQSDVKLNSILNQQYVSRNIISDLCAIVHLEEALRDNGFVVDTVPPCKPKLAYDVIATSNDKTYIELIGERNSSIYLNGINTGLQLDSDGRYYDFELNTTIQRDTFDDFYITFVDATTKISDKLNLTIYNDTDQPYITDLPTNNTITITKPSQYVDTFTASDDTIDNNIAVSYELSGNDQDFFTITQNGYDKGILTFKSPSTVGTYHITIKVTDKANHYDTTDLTITVN